MLELSPSPTTITRSASATPAHTGTIDTGSTETHRRGRVLARRKDNCAAQRVVRQLLEAAIFEGLIDCIVADSRIAGGAVVADRRAEAGGSQTVTDNPAVAGRQSVADDAAGRGDRHDTVTTFYFSLGGQPFSCQGRQRGFDRIRLYLTTLARLQTGRRTPLAESDLPDLLQIICRDLSHDPQTALSLHAELLQTQRWTEWNQQYLPGITGRHALPYRALEAASHEGHPYHPCYKGRRGFTVQDHRQYSAECGAPFQLHWLALHADDLDDHLPQTVNSFWHQELGSRCFQQLQDQLQDQLQNQLPQTGRSADTYRLVPVHPWQMANYLAPRLSAALSTGQAVDLGTAGDFYVASQSLRTLLNVTRPAAANIKLPLDIVCTSSQRFLLSHGVCTAPHISRWLSSLVQSDAFFVQHPLVILREYAGIRADETHLFADANTDECHLGAIWRESIESRLQPGEQALPMTALYAEEPDARPLIHHWVTHYGLVRWLQQLLQVVVLPVWHLLARHGVALEAHAQNTILIHRNGWPVKLAVRDFHESLEFVEDFIPEKNRLPRFAAINPVYSNAPPDRYYRMASVEALRELVMDTLFVFHLSELAELCEAHWGYAETTFWHRVRQLLDDYQCNHPELADRIDRIGHLRPTLAAESLLTRKLQRDSTAECHHGVRNPLSSPTPR